ncbi:MAG: DUF3303 family protein [Acidobacteria bacterium]|nr:DUF3303 family protein [Acidobacteriota bacterium]
MPAAKQWNVCWLAWALRRWHAIDGSHGFTLTESDDSVAMYEATAVWAGVIDLHILAKVYKKV